MHELLHEVPHGAPVSAQEAPDPRDEPAGVAGPTGGRRHHPRLRRAAHVAQLDHHGGDVGEVEGAEVGADVEVVARVTAASRPEAVGRIVAVRQRHLLATSFHPEITGDARIHRVFVELVRGRS